MGFNIVKMKKLNLPKSIRTNVTLHLYRKTPHKVPRTDRTFLFFLGVTSCNSVQQYYVQQCIFFSTISGPFSHNLDRDIDPRSRFFNFFDCKNFWKNNLKTRKQIRSNLRDPKLRVKDLVNLNNLIQMNFAIEEPEDPAYSTPDRSRFFIFSGHYVRYTMCNSVFFFNYFGHIFTQFRPGYRPQKSFFWIIFRFFLAI